MKIAVCISTPEVPVPVPVALLSGSFAERLQKAAALGYDGVELFAVRPSELNSDDIRGQLAESGLEAAAIGTGAIGLVDGLTLLASDVGVSQRAAARLHEIIDFAAAVGAPLVTIGGFRGKYRNVGGEPGRARLVKVLRTAAEQAARNEIRLVLEPLNRYESDAIHNTDEGLDLVDQVDHSHLGLLLDLFHMNIEEASFDDAFRTAHRRHRLWHVHMSDSNRLPPGQGHLDWKAIVASLHDIGYDEYLSAELLPNPTPDEAAAATIRHLRRFVAAPD